MRRQHSPETRCDAHLAWRCGACRRQSIGRFLTVALVLMLATRGIAPAMGQETVTDLCGRRVTVPENVDRLVALGPGALRLVAYLGAVERVVGIEEMERRMDRSPWLRPYAAALPSAFFGRPVVAPGGPGKLPDFERLLICRPDLIVVTAMGRRQASNIQAKTGIPTVVLSYGELGVWRKEAHTSLTLLGELLGRRERAAEVNTYIRRAVAELASRTEGIPREDRPTVYFGGVSLKGAQGLMSTEIRYPPGRMVNARNVADQLGKQGHVFLDREQLLAWKPEVVFVDIAGRAVLEQNARRKPGYTRLLSDSHHAVFYSVLPYNYYNTNIELALLNAWFVGKCLYPQRFEDIEMGGKADAVFAALLGFSPKGSPPAYERLHFRADGSIRWRAP